MQMATSRTILGLSGSLRAASLNTALLRTIGQHVPAGVRFQQLDCHGVPLFNEDIAVPKAVQALKDAIATADAILIATPEYNHSVAGVLKNAIDWASRPAYESPFAGKFTGIVSASKSFVGGARAQQHLKTILVGMGARVYAGPELLVGAAHEKTAEGQINDPEILQNIRKFVDAYSAWALITDGITDSTGVRD